MGAGAGEGGDKDTFDRCFGGGPLLIVARRTTHHGPTAKFECQGSQARDGAAVGTPNQALIATHSARATSAMRDLKPMRWRLNARPLLAMSAFA